MQGDTRTELAKGHITPETKEQLKVLAGDKYECSQSAAIQELIQDAYRRTYGDLDPQSVQENRVEAADLVAVKRGEVSSEDLDPALRYDDAPSPPAVSDGGAAAHPGSYSPTYGPAELRQSGPELEWDELKDVVSDGRWNDSVEINPDRVPVPDEAVPISQQSRLRASRTPSARIVVAMCRFEFDGQVHRNDIESMIDEYLSHITDRGREGRQYVREQYFEHIVEELGDLYENPNPNSPLLYTEVEAYRERLDGLTESLAEDVGSPESHTVHEKSERLESPETLLDFNAWANYHGVPATKHNRRDWLETVADWLRDLSTLWNLYTNHAGMVGQFEGDDTIAFEVDYPDAFQDAPDFIRALARGHVETFVEAVPEEVRTELLDHHVSPEVAGVLRNPVDAMS